MTYTDPDFHEREFGTPSLASEADAVRDARVAELEDALRQIATVPALGSSLARTLDRCILIAREALGAAEVEVIPAGIKFPRGEVAFTRYPASDDGTWHLIGPDVLLVEGTVIEVQRFTESEPSLVGVGRVVAERTVVHHDAGPVRYVVARIARGAVRD